METREEFLRRIGKVELGAGFYFRSRGQVLRDFGFAIVLAVAFAALIVWWLWPSLLHVGGGLIAFATYAAAARFVRVRPNHDEMGIGGSMVNHPFRRSDDVNAYLVYLVVLMAPGRYVSTGLADGIRLLRTGKLPHDGFMDGSGKRERL